MRTFGLSSVAIHQAIIAHKLIRIIFALKKKRFLCYQPKDTSVNKKNQGYFLDENAAETSAGTRRIVYLYSVKNTFMWISRRRFEFLDLIHLDIAIISLSKRQ